MITENLMMAAVRAGEDRQEVHEVVRRCSHAVTERIKEGTGTTAELLEKLRAEKQMFSRVDFAKFARQAPTDFVGRAPEQVAEFVAESVEPIRQRYAGALGMMADLHV